jgi:hypothetical protein
MLCEVTVAMCFGHSLKPGSARQVDLGPGRPEHRTGPNLSKNPLGSWPSETRSTRVNPAETRPFFFNIYMSVCNDVISAF